MRPRVLVVVLLAGALLGACRARPAALAPSTTPVEKGEYVVLGQADGSAWGAMLFCIPVHGRMAQGAIDSALADYEGADGLVNVSLDYTTFWLLLASVTRAHVHGEAFRRTH